MKTQSRDTDIASEEKLIEMLRGLTDSERLKRSLELSSFAIALSKRAIKRANHGLTQRELDLLFVEYHYGKELAGKVKKRLEQT